MSLRPLLVGCVLLLSALAACAAETPPVRAAFMYCSWPNGQASFKDEFDEAFKALGWQVTKFENTQARALSGRLGEFDVVVGGGVSNLEPPQDFTPFAAQWQAFLNRGGVVIATDASYAPINAGWIGALDPALMTTSAICSSHSKPSAETAKVTFDAQAPLLSLPHDLEAGLTIKGCWAHLDNVASEWTVAARCYDGKPLLIYRAVGKGLVVETSYFRFAGANGVGRDLLQNAVTLAAGLREGLQVVRLQEAPGVLGDNKVTVRLRNSGPRQTTVVARLALKGAKSSVEGAVEQSLPAGEETEVSVPVRLPLRGRYEGALELSSGGRAFLSFPQAIVVPELVTVSVRSRHQYPHYEVVRAHITLAPELRQRLPNLSVQVGCLPVEAAGAQPRPVSVKPTALEADAEVPLRGLAPGSYGLQASLLERTGGKTATIARGETPIVLHADPQVKFSKRNVCYVAGKPFFPLGMYHVAWGASREQMLKCVDDLADAGFNAVHTSCSNQDVFQEVLDRAQARGLKVLVEGLGDKFSTVARFKDHPALLAWNSGDEPDCANVPPATVGANVDGIRDVDPNHLVYTTVAGADMLRQYAPYVDVFSNDPYPLSQGNTDAVAVARQTARARESVRQARPLWIVPQCFGYEKGPWQVPTPAQERSMTYQALIEGANGLIWYTYHDTGFEVLDHPELWAMMRQLVAEVRTLTPVLLEPAYEAQRAEAGPGGCVRLATIRDGRMLTVLVAHTNEKDLGVQELKLPGVDAGGKAEVLFENRSVKLSGGTLSDTFAPYAVHVYRIGL